MSLDRQEFIASLGGDGAVAGMSCEAKADALEDYLMRQLNEARAAQKFPTAAEVQAQIETRPFRRGAGNLFLSQKGNVRRLPPMPEKPTLIDFFKLRFRATSNHVVQSASLARKNGLDEEIVLACLLHDTVQELIKVDHGWWCAQLYEPYVSEKVAFAIRHHQTLRFYEDEANGYKYPDLYRVMFGDDYKPEPYIEANYKFVRNHKWYIYPRLVTVNDLYAFEPGVNPRVEEFADIIGRHFKQPKEGLGFDNSPVAHMWRSISMPDRPL
ncbi:MAG TPA: hypothetical protein VKV74_02305 [Bryobacteraceae bacterium]|nr:hypothetical protein [Bryobacteraceae bacterium]